MISAIKSTTSVLLGLLALLILPGQTMAQESPIVHATIPFDFWIESSRLPAGVYQIENLDSTAYLLFRSRDGKVVKDAYTLPLDETPAKEADAKLVFKVENGKYYLYGGWGPSGRRVVTMEAAQTEPSGDARYEVTPDLSLAPFDLGGTRCATSCQFLDTLILYKRSASLASDTSARLNADPKATFCPQRAFSEVEP